MDIFLAGGLILFLGTVTTTFVGLVGANLLEARVRSACLFAAAGWTVMLVINLAAQSLFLPEATLLVRVLASSILATLGSVGLLAVQFLRVHRSRD